MPEEKAIVKNYTVKELMIPLSEYATVTVGATLYEAVLALEEAQLDFDLTRYRHRAILVLDERGDVVGKMSQLDVLRALEPKYNDMLKQGQHQQHYGLSKKYMESIMAEFNLWDNDLSSICRKSGAQPVTKFMRTLTEGEYVDENTTMAEAVHQLVMSNSQSLMVTQDNKIIGILRLTDVFASIFHTMKECFSKDK
jgi:CBS domain-containing protein